jgi:hypothetical protein
VLLVPASAAGLVVASALQDDCDEAAAEQHDAGNLAPAEAFAKDAPLSGT